MRLPLRLAHIPVQASKRYFSTVPPAKVAADMTNFVKRITVSSPEIYRCVGRPILNGPLGGAANARRRLGWVESDLWNYMSISTHGTILPYIYIPSEHSTS